MPTVLLAHKQFGAAKGLSHIGLGVAAINTVKVLRANGFIANAIAINTVKDLVDYLAKGTKQDFVIVSAPWIPTLDLQKLSETYTETQFFVCCHSNVGFLQADTNAVKLIREAIELEASSHNFHLAGNSTRFCDWIIYGFNAPCVFLPNLYYLDSHAGLPNYHSPICGTLKVGIFGATRPLKNMLTGVGAALDLARNLRLPLEVWISGGRIDGGYGILNAIQQLVAGLPGVTLKIAPWSPWPNFRTLVGTMNINFQFSYTESFNMTIADSISQGVPAVVSSAITWLPKEYQVDSDDTHAIANAARRVLFDPHSAKEGLAGLKEYVKSGVRSYKEVLV